MRILYVGNHQPDVPEERRWSTEWHVGETISAAGHDLTREQERPGVWADVPRRAKEVDAEMVLWTRTYGMDRDLDAQRAGLDALRSMGVPSVTWHLDKFWDLPRAEQVTSEPWFTADYVFTADGGNQDRWASAGVNHHWLPPAVFAPECVLGSAAPEFAADVAFVGSWANYHPEWKHRRDLVKWCFHSFGGNRFKTWPRANQGQVRGARLSDLYATAKVIVGDSCMVGGTGKYWSDRISETLGRGGLLLHPFTDGLTDSYTPGVHLDCWEMGDWTGLRVLIDRYLSDEALRMSVRLEGHEHVKLNHTYANRLDEVLRVVAGG